MPNSSSTTMHPTTPSSSATMAKMKSLCALGSQPHLSWPWPSPTPNQPPSATAQRPCRYWYRPFLASGSMLGSKKTFSRASR